MIITKFEDFCQNCAEVVPIVEDVRREYGGIPGNCIYNPVGVSTVITCKNINKCQMLFEHIKREENKKKKGEKHD